MATVRMTKDLKSAIISKLQGQFTVRRNAVQKAIQDGFTHMIPQYKADLLSVMLEQFGMPQDIYDAIPESWCHRAETLCTNNINGVSTSGVLPTVKFEPSVKIPAEMDYRVNHWHVNHPRLQPYADYAHQANEQLRQLAHEEHSAVSEANRLLAQAGSLKQALDAWPHLMELLPDWAVKQHNEVAEKRQKAGPIKIDADRLTGALVAGKMAIAVLNRQ